ncbi:hypothetical protein LZ480_07605 [Solibacillus sp. MA9]|uniref:Uncharacterized protein n=1 Tax=Solibacillus palustris TaxID=2908203 RepID=A0ABS9UBP4_9BACL|nr:hypothetical protein [Solibacillus sp. MA9]MCH7321757.1 hypothetical protein [Solibacillus sp. MA9]
MKPILMGFNGVSPLAIIFWYKPGEETPFCKTICYDEDDVIAMHNRHTTPGDFYNKLEPSVHLVDSNEPLQQVA